MYSKYHKYLHVDMMKYIRQTNRRRIDLQRDPRDLSMSQYIGISTDPWEYHPHLLRYSSIWQRAVSLINPMIIEYYHGELLVDTNRLL